MFLPERTLFLLMIRCKLDSSMPCLSQSSTMSPFQISPEKDTFDSSHEENLADSSAFSKLENSHDIHNASSMYVGGDRLVSNFFSTSNSDKLCIPRAKEQHSFIALQQLNSELQELRKLADSAQKLRHDASLRTEQALDELQKLKSDKKRYLILMREKLRQVYSDMSVSMDSRQRNLYTLAEDKDSVENDAFELRLTNGTSPSALFSLKEDRENRKSKSDDEFVENISTDERVVRELLRISVPSPLEADNLRPFLSSTSHDVEFFSRRTMKMSDPLLSPSTHLGRTSDNVASFRKKIIETNERVENATQKMSILQAERDEALRLLDMERNKLHEVRSVVFSRFCTSATFCS